MKHFFISWLFYDIRNRLSLHFIVHFIFHFIAQSGLIGSIAGIKKDLMKMQKICIEVLFFASCFVL